MRRLSVFFLCWVMTFPCALCSQTQPADTSSPSGIACQDVETCVAQKREEFSGRGTLEMLIHPIVDEADEHFSYWRVVEVFPAGAAKEARLRKGDVIAEWNGEPLPKNNPRFLVPRLESVKINDEVILGVLRSGKRHTISVTAAKPDETTMEYWLLTYVKNNFSDAEFDHFASKSDVHLVKAPSRRDG